MNLPAGLLRDTDSRPNQLIQDPKIGDTFLCRLDGPGHHIPSSDLPSPSETKLSGIHTHL